MYLLIVIGWIYVVLMVAVAQAASGPGHMLGAVLTFVFYGLLPAALLAYIMRTGMRRRKRHQQEQVHAPMPRHPSGANDEAAPEPSDQPNANRHAPGAAQDAGISAVREKT